MRITDVDIAEEREIRVNGVTLKLDATADEALKRARGLQKAVKWTEVTGVDGFAVFLDGEGEITVRPIGNGEDCNARN
jgi:hypothetical protein